MATGDKICPNCGQWQIHCKCGWAAARQRESWGYRAEPTSVDWAAGESYTVIANPGEWSTTTKITRKPRRRRHHRQVVY